jgi:hypothetical protein
VPAAEAEPPARADGTPLPALVVDRAEARNLVVRLERPRAPTSALRLRRLALAAAVSPERVVVAGRTNGRLDRGPLRVTARVRTAPARRRVRVAVTTRRADLARTLGFVADGGARDVRGTVDLAVRYDDAVHGGHRHGRVRGRLAGRALAVGAHGRDGVRVGALSLPRFALDLVRRHAVASALRVRDVDLVVEREDAGIGIPGVLASRAAGPADEPAPAWTYEAAGATVSNARVEYRDRRAPDAPVTLAVARAEVGAVGAPESPLPVAADGTLASGGRVAIRGHVVRAPLGASVHVALDRVAVPALARFAAVPVELESATASGEVDVAGSAAHGLEASGTVELDDVKTISPDPHRPENVIAWKSLRLAVRQARTDPPSLDVARADLAWPYVLVDRTPESIFPLSLAASTAPAPEGGGVPIHVGRLTVEGGRIDFRDAVLQPPYWRSLAALALDARGIDVPSTHVRHVAANGLVDEISPLRLEGHVGTKTELHLELDRVALPPFNAYLTPVSTYAVSSGVASTKTELVLDRSELEVSSRIVLSRLGLAAGGEDFVGRELGIPITLALALMKDYRGDIALDLPFGGDVHAPAFSVRSVALQALLKAIQGAVLSPLNALGRVFLRDGRIEGYELAGIPFAPAESALGPAARERMAQVARVVSLHPELVLRVRGTVAPEDADRLQDAAALAALKDGSGAEPLRRVLRARLAGAEPPPLDGARRRRLDTFVAGLPWPAAALETLALDRGAATAAAFVTDFGLAPDRVRAVDPAPAAPGGLGARPEASLELRED